jgi:thymidylate synthase (FAD)
MLLDETRQALVKQFEHTDVLDHGFVRLDDLMGDDHDVCRAARLSTGNTRAKIDLVRDAKLIHYLMRHEHLTPFEQCEIKLHMRLPIFVARQILRTRTASPNEMSGRYSELPNEFYIPENQHIRKQDSINKQGSAEPVDELTARRQSFGMRSVCEADFDQYHVGLDAGVARETARIVLPLGTYTEIIFKIDLRNLLHFIVLRTDPHAQYEIQVYADVMAKIVRAWVPQTWDAFEQYRLNATVASWAVMTALAKNPNCVASIAAALTDSNPNVVDFRTTADEFIVALKSLV